jgi:quercetin dioxygenase-like cupin family protein
MAVETRGPAANPSEEIIRFAGLEIHFLVSAADSNQNVALFEFSVPPGMKVPGAPHFNEGYEETVYGLEGTLTWTVNGREVEVGPGQALCIRRGETHAWANHGTTPAKQLTVVTPGIMGPEYFREVAHALNAGGPPEPAQMVAIMRRHGMVPAAPKPA